MEDFSRKGSGVQDMGPQIGGLLVQIQQRVPVQFVRIRQKLLEMAILICVILLVFWFASFLYGSFYYSVMPTANFITPVHFYYRTDCPSPHQSMCSFLEANVSLLKNGKHQVMINGQPYQIMLELEMPESPANQQLGMFLVKMAPYSTAGQVVATSARSARIHYSSSLLQSLHTVLFSPMLLTGVSVQKQSVMVELFSEFREDSYKPSVGAVIEIHSPHIQIYRAHLYIFAHYTGIRYLMYQFPLTSSVIAVMSNFSFLSLILVLSFLQFSLNGRRLLPGKADMQQKELEEDSNDQFVEENATASTTHLLDSPLLMGSNAIEMEESIPDMGVDKSEDSR
ncbi:seipin-like [Xyrauchen texanus]|uniref:seipin-like n=1 Tax=Xyrauchen texanus TaxID=154827 RepID=UPI00224221E6|nr:seipin-like [Xyrauchen texanus]